jgi:Uma2 family endonuclease
VDLFRFRREYWIIDLDARLIEKWRPGDQRPEISTQELTWEPKGLPHPFVLDVAEFFSRVWRD